MNYSDLAGRYLTQRMDQATRPFTDPEAYMSQRLNNAFPTAETEEEKRKRLELEAAARGETVTPVKETRTIDPVTGEVKLKIEGNERDLSPVNPNTPNVSSARPNIVATQPNTAPAPAAAPVAPDTYQRMIQAESGGRDFDAQGRPLTSPAGAMFKSQVMPSTAANPGFGIKPAAAQTPEEYNRVGQEYYQAMLKQFGGDEQKAIAAYNAGPGRVQQNIQANGGQMNVAQLPQETQGYLNKVQAPTAPVAPTAQQQPPIMIAGNASSDVGATPTEQAINQQRAYWANDLEKAQNDSTSLYAIAGNKERYPEEVRKIAKAKALELDRRVDEEQKAEKLLKDMATGDVKATNQAVRDLRKQTGEGSYLKAYLFGRLGLNDLAREEQSKLGAGAFSQVTLDNKQYLVNTKNGAIVGAYDNAGAAVDDTVLAKLNAEALGPGKIDIVGGTYVSDTLKDKNGNALVGRVVSNKQTGASYIQTDEGRMPMAGFRPQASTGSLGDMRARTIQDLNLKLQGKTEEEKMAILRPYNQQLAGAGYQPISASEVGISAPQIGGAPAIPAAAPTAPVAAAPGGPVNPAAPVQITPTQVAPTTAAPATTARPTANQLSADKARTEETGKLTGKAEGEVAGKDVKNQAFADSSYSLIKPISDAIKESTGSALGSGVDTVASAIGKSTKGAQAIAKLDVLGYSLVSNVPRFEGPQGVRDVELYERAAGDLANSKKPIETRLAALDAVITLLKKYDRAGTNDWTFSGETKSGGGGIKIISREKI